MAEERVRVLLLDDEESLRVPLKDYLEKNFGYRVDAVASGEEALRQVEAVQGCYDVALIDEVLLNPPDGIEVMQQIKARYPDIECIVFTGWKTESRQRALQAGAFRYLEKPFNTDELTMLIRTAAQQVRLREIGRAILSERDLDRVLEGITNAACSLALADKAAIALLEQTTGKITVHVRVGLGEQVWTKHFKNQNLTKEIIHAGRIEYVPDTTQDDRVNPEVIDAGLRSFLGLPIPGEGGNLGVLYVYSRQPGRFDEGSTVAVLQTLAGQAGLAIANARAFHQLEQMRQAAEAMSRVFEPRQALQQIVESAAQVLQADSAAIWSYDEVRDVFISEELVAVGIPPDELERFRGEELKPGHPADTVIHEGYVPVTDISLPQYGFLGQPTRDLLNRIGVRSFQSIALRVGDERLGVLYVNHNRPRKFSEDDEARLRTFASHAALSLKNARLLAQMQRTREAAGVIAGVTLQEDLTQTLRTIARHTQQALQSDAVCLYTYDETMGRLGDEWAVEIPNPRAPDSAYPPHKVSPTSVVWSILSLVEPPYYHLAEDHVPDDHLLGGRFVREEGMQAAIGIQLRVGEHKVGVMFVNFRSAHRFTADEIATIQLFADQAAVAIRNAQLYQELQQRYEELKRTKGLVGARTALAWMGMASSAWRHAIDNHTRTIREQIQLLRRDLGRAPSHDHHTKVDERLSMIERLANQILERPIVPPLSREEGVEPVALNDLVGERARQLWQNDPYKKARLQLDLQLPGSATVRASPEWLRRAFDILVDNAVEAVADCEVREITIGTQAVDRGAEIRVSDTGPGIPEEIRAKIFLEPIEKPEDAKGLGMGLLMAQTIVQTYGGELRVESTSPRGTTMVIWLPLAQ